MKHGKETEEARKAEVLKQIEPLNIWTTDGFHEEFDAPDHDTLPEEYQGVMVKAMLLAVLEAAIPAGNA